MRKAKALINSSFIFVFKMQLYISDNDILNNFKYLMYIIILKRTA